jgi:hypothetical protein
MFLQAGSGIDAGSVSCGTTLNCLFLIPHSTCGTAALIDSPRRFLQKNRGTAGWPCPNFLVRLQLLLERARRKRANRKNVAAAGAGVR